MCHVSSPHEVLGSLHFKRRVRMEEKLIRKWCFFLNPSSAEAPFLLKKKICVSFTLPLQSLETPLQTMWQHQLNSQLSWGRDTPAWENIVTQHRLQACVCVCVCEYVHVSVCVCVCVCRRERQRECWWSEENWVRQFTLRNVSCPFLATPMNLNISPETRQRDKQKVRSYTISRRFKGPSTSSERCDSLASF